MAKRRDEVDSVDSGTSDPPTDTSAATAAGNSNAASMKGFDMSCSTLYTLLHWGAC